MLYYCNTVRWAWLDWGLSGWLTTLLQCFDAVGWVIRLVKTVGRIIYIVLAQTYTQSINSCFGWMWVNKLCQDKLLFICIWDRSRQLLCMTQVVLWQVESRRGRRHSVSNPQRWCVLGANSSTQRTRHGYFTVCSNVQVDCHIQRLN